MLRRLLRYLGLSRPRPSGNWLADLHEAIHARAGRYHLELEELSGESPPEVVRQVRGRLVLPEGDPGDAAFLVFAAIDEAVPVPEGCARSYAASEVAGRAGVEFTFTDALEEIPAPVVPDLDEPGWVGRERQALRLREQAEMAQIRASFPRTVADAKERGWL